MREPAHRTEGGGGEEGAPAREPGALQLTGPGVEDLVHARGEAGVLHCDPAVALDEDQQDVLATQAGQEICGGTLRIGSVLAARANSRWSRSSAGIRLDLAVDVGRGLPRCHRAWSVRTSQRPRASHRHASTATTRSPGAGAGTRRS